METDEIRMRRLRMRSWRRGMKEMDLILGPFADQHLTFLTENLLTQYELMLNENDQNLYRWVAARSRGEVEGPQEISAILDLIVLAVSEKTARKDKI